MPNDPVCGMEVEEDTPYTLEFQGETYYFCSRICADEFLENSEEYTASEAESFGE